MPRKIYRSLECYRKELSKQSQHLRVIYINGLCQLRDTTHLYLNAINSSLYNNFTSQTSYGNYFVNCNILKTDCCVPQLCAVQLQPYSPPHCLFVFILILAPQSCKFTLFLCIFYNLKAILFLKSYSIKHKISHQ